MAEISPGMTPDQVESALGAPLDRLDFGGFRGDAGVAPRDAAWDTWLYTDFPREGTDTVVVFEDGRVDHVISQRRPRPGD
ncbi:hypothetical protein [Streptomyces sp. SBT349]|uniref:hypothetical protein n=1 Tax=Streptomyces sp. SBT349 TaxID=1580539 RepID=UPI00066B8951|nr:hypothetical protein [Streptomyces sp. SBT349]